MVRQRALLLAVLILFLASSSRAEEVLFRKQVVPILEERCLGCHGEKTRKGELSLATASDALAGGKSGPVIVPGRPRESLLIQMISGSKPKMPRKGKPLTAEQVALVKKWIEVGAIWPKGLTLRSRETEDGREAGWWWSLRPLARPELPKVKNAAWVRNPVDAFILNRLEKERLAPSPQADRRTLIRRLCYDLLGLPPTPEEIDAFLKDTSCDAYDKLVDRLLQSPRYGERWARHWLDVVHYGDSHGYDKDKPRPNAWPYRDYVIAAFNKDKPYSRFVQEQIAGDVLDPGEPDGIIATGFLAAGPWDFVGHVELREDTVDKKKVRLIDRDDMLANTISTFMSLTVHCARCHDHKFDPIPQKDYYRLQAVFAGINRGDRPYVLPRRVAQPSGPSQAGSPSYPEKPVDKSKQVYAVAPQAPRPIHFLRRGDVEQPGDLMAPGTLALVPGLDQDFKLADPGNEGQRRAALARWLADPRNVVTWRSIVNRVWHYHFGRGLVDTPNDFGRNGSLPSHPELLDWLAVEFRDNGQSLKKLHRLILLSSTYRQSSGNNESFAKMDGDNRLLWRMNRQRLDAESIRDSVLAISGKLDLKMGGPAFQLFRFKDDHSPVYDHTAIDRLDDPQTWRRTVYRFVVRSVPNPWLESLDCADPNINTPVRNTTLTALQALALLHDAFMVKQSEYCADRIKKMRQNLETQVAVAADLVFGRPLAAEEKDLLTAYAKKHGLANLCRMLFNANEFVFVD